MSQPNLYELPVWEDFEQRVVEALEPCDWAYVLDVGRCVASGPPEQIMTDARIRQAYLGMQ